MRRLLVLRPEPGASSTAAAARALGREATTAPLFTVEPVEWTPPAGDFDAVMLTSANAARCGGAALARVRHLPCHAVGEATAAAARDAGFALVSAGERDAAALLGGMAAAGVRRALHLAGEVHRPIVHPTVEVMRVIVYRTQAIGELPVEARAALGEGAIALIHSPAAGALFARLVDRAAIARAGITLAAISAAAADAAGRGWAATRVALVPTDAALLAIAAEVCEEAAAGSGGRA